MVDANEDFTHFDEQGRARMVNVGDKDVSERHAVAAGRILVNERTFELIKSGGVKKGDVLTVAQTAGIMAAKRASALIPMCHPLLLNGVDLSLTLDKMRLSVEALTAVSVALLTVYDMCKAVQRDMTITDVRLLSKSGGMHGDFTREEGACSE